MYARELSKSFVTLEFQICWKLCALYVTLTSVCVELCWYLMIHLTKSWMLFTSTLAYVVNLAFWL